MAESIKQILAKPILLADQVTKTADDARTFRQECAELKAKTEKLASLLRQAARSRCDLYERPTRRIIEEVEQVLDKALLIVSKCRANGLMKRVFTIIPTAQFKRTSNQLDNSIGDVSWLLRVSAPAGDPDNDDIEYLGLPPIAANEPILCLIWEQIATLHTGSLEDRSDAAASLVSLARDNDRYGKLIVEEGGVPPLLKLIKEGRNEAQEHAVKGIGLLARDAEAVENMMHAGVCTLFAKILKEGCMKIQSVVAWAVSELAAAHPKCQDHFAQNNIIRLLVSHLAFETIQEHSKYTVVTNKGLSIHSVVLANNDSSNDDNISGANGNEGHEDDDKHIKSQMKRPLVPNNDEDQMHSVVKSTIAGKSQPLHSQSLQHPKGGGNKKAKSVAIYGPCIKGRENEDPSTKATMKAMAAKAMWNLAKGNSAICKSICESRALLCFAVLVEKGAEEVQFNSAMALMEIAAVAEKNSDLRRSAFKPTSPAAKAVVDQLLKIVEEADSNLLIPCINAIGSLARTFRATETRMIGPLVRLLDEREGEFSHEAVVALTKFACTENYLHVDHSRAIIKAGGAKHLIQLVYFSEQIVQISSLILLCYVAMHVPESEELAQAEVLTALEWSSKQHYMVQDETVDEILPEAKGRLELYQARGTKGFH